MINLIIDQNNLLGRQFIDDWGHITTITKIMDDGNYCCISERQGYSFLKKERVIKNLEMSEHLELPD